MNKQQAWIKKNKSTRDESTIIKRSLRRRGIKKGLPGEVRIDCEKSFSVFLITLVGSDRDEGVTSLAALISALAAPF